MNGLLKQISLWVILLIIVVLALSHFSELQNKPTTKLWEKHFVEQLTLGNIKEMKIRKIDEDLFKVRATFDHPAYDNQDHVEFNTDNFKEEWRRQLDVLDVPNEIELGSDFFVTFLVNVVPIILIIGVFWFFMFRHMQGGNNKALSFGKSRARLVGQDEKTVTFADVAGVDEAKEELIEIVEFLRDPKKFTRLGGKIPKGVLLIGPPGTGKTLLARAVSGEASVPFFSISGSDFVEMFVGVGASRVRDLFQQGLKHAPCIIFVDEIDAVGRQRGAGLGGGHDEREQTLNQLLVEMDGFSANDGVIMMAATNRPDVLDRALLRPGRFDRQVVVGVPDIKGREAIMNIHITNGNLPLDDDVEVKKIARGTPGFTGADLANLVNEAALFAARRDQENVKMHDFEEAKDRVLMGPERRSMVISEKEKKLTAVHEAGHALVCRLVPDADPVHKVTIIPRGPSLGLTSWLPEEDRHNVSKKYCLAMIRVAMGGRAAEDVVFKEFTSGAAGDLKMATQRAHSMVCEWGMSQLGPIAFGSQQEVFLGRDFTRERDYSDETASAVDNAIHAILEEAYAHAKEMVTKHESILMAIADALIERETLSAEQLDDVIRANGGADLIPEPKVVVEEVVEKEAALDVTPEDPVEERPAGDEDEGLKDVPPGDIVPGTA